MRRSRTGCSRAGPLHNWQSIQRSIRVDAFDPHFTTGRHRPRADADRLRSGRRGQVVKTQRVYPNRRSRLGSLTIYRSDYGLAATVSLVNTSGAETGRSVAAARLLRRGHGRDACRLDSFTVPDAPATPCSIGTVTVPLDRSGARVSIGACRNSAKAHVVMVARDGTEAVDRVVSRRRGHRAADRRPSAARRRRVLRAPQRRRRPDDPVPVRGPCRCDDRA